MDKEKVLWQRIFDLEKEALLWQQRYEKTNKEKMDAVRSEDYWRGKYETAVESLNKVIKLLDKGEIKDESHTSVKD